MDSEKSRLKIEELDYLARYVDGELDESESALVESWIAERPAVRDYVQGLEWNGEGVRLGIDALFEGSDVEALEEDALEGRPAVNFDHFWEGIASRIAVSEEVASENNVECKNSVEEVDQARREQERNALLRDVVLYSDSELVDEGRKSYFEELFAKDRDVLDGEERTAYDLFYSLKEARGCVVSACEQMLSKVPFDVLTKNIRDAVEQESSLPASVLKEERPANDNFFKRYRQAFVGALAAICMIGMSGLIYYAVYGKNPTIIHKTVVVVEDVQYGPGFSGEVVNPVQQVSAPKENAGKTDGEEEPTVIWVYDEPKDGKKKDDEEKLHNGVSSDNNGVEQNQDELKDTSPTKQTKPRGISI